jgi:hypothetical protein
MAALLHSNACDPVLGEAAYSARKLRATVRLRKFFQPTFFQVLVAQYNSVTCMCTSQGPMEYRSQAYPLVSVLLVQQ